MSQSVLQQSGVDIMPNYALESSFGNDHAFLVLRNIFFVLALAGQFRSWKIQRKHMSGLVKCCSIRIAKLGHASAVQPLLRISSPSKLQRKCNHHFNGGLNLLSPFVSLALARRRPATSTNVAG